MEWRIFRRRGSLRGGCPLNRVLESRISIRRQFRDHQIPSKIPHQRVCVFWRLSGDLCKLCRIFIVFRRPGGAPGGGITNEGRPISVVPDPFSCRSVRLEPPPVCRCSNILIINGSAPVRCRAAPRGQPMVPLRIGFYSVFLFHRDSVPFCFQRMVEGWRGAGRGPLMGKDSWYHKVTSQDNCEKRAARPRSSPGALFTIGWALLNPTIAANYCHG